MDACGVETKDSEISRDWIPKVIGYLALALPTAWLFLTLAEHFQIKSATLTPIIEHPLVRSLVGVGGGLLLFRLLWRPKPRRILSLVPGAIRDEAGAWAALSELLKDDPELATLIRSSGAVSDSDELGVSGGVAPMRLADIVEDDVVSDDFDYMLSEELADLRPFAGEDLEPVSLNHPARLTIELTPRSCWFSNLRAALSDEQWDRLRRQVYNRAGRRCEVCGGKGRRWPVEAHETWSYDDESGVQRLDTIRALCPRCHQAKHYGLALLQGREEDAEEHLREVNGWDGVTTARYIKSVFALWHARSSRPWRVELSALKEFGFTESEIETFERGVTPNRAIH